jgi:hypothetical protein
MNRLTFDFFTFARKQEGEVLHTAEQGLPYAVRSDRDRLTFTPASSGKPRLENETSVCSVLNKYVTSHSVQVADYSKLSSNAPFIVPLVEAFFAQRTGQVPVASAGASRAR